MTRKPRTHVRILIYRTWAFESPSLAVPLVSILMKFNCIGMFSVFFIFSEAGYAPSRWQNDKTSNI